MMTSGWHSGCFDREPNVCSRARGGAGKVAKMCIPIELDVPVVTLDGQRIGIAREILCPCPGEVSTSSSPMSETLAATYSPTDLWLRVTSPFRSDLYVPFGEIAETRADGVLLRLPQDELSLGAWERPPAGLAVPA